MNFENHLITRVVDTGEIKDAARVLASDHFFDVQARSAWNYVRAFYQEHGEVPSRDMLSANLPQFQFVITSDPVSALVDRLVERYVYNEIALSQEKVAELATTNVEAARLMYVERAAHLRTLGTSRSEHLDLTSVVQEEVDAYYRRATTKGLLGLPWPWPRLNKATYGIRDGQWVCFYARPKNFKTFLMLYSMHTFHYTMKKRPVVFTREMTREELRQRYCAIWAGVDYTRYCEGRLTTPEENRWIEAMQAFAESSPIIIASCEGVGAEAADSIVAMAQELEADVVGIDGVHLFGNREWDVMAEFSSRIKQHALETYKVPYIGTSQGAKAKTKKSNADDIMYSDALLQDADYIIKCTHVPEDTRIYLSLPAIREGKYCEFSVWAKPAYDFSQAFTDEQASLSEDAEQVATDDSFVQGGT